MPKKKKQTVTVSMTFRNFNITKLFSDMADGTKFDKAWKVRHIFMRYFADLEKIGPENTDIFNEIINISHKKNYLDRFTYRVRVTFSNPAVVNFFINRFPTKTNRAYFLKNIVLAHLNQKGKLERILRGELVGGEQAAPAGGYNRRKADGKAKAKPSVAEIKPDNTPAPQGHTDKPEGEGLGLAGLGDFVDMMASDGEDG